MNQQQIAEYILNKPEVIETTHYNSNAKIFKVRHKTFATLSNEDNGNCWLSVKTPPELALELRQQHQQVVAGLQMNKKHWNSILLEQGFCTEQLRQLIDSSFRLVIEGMPLHQRDELLQRLKPVTSES